MNVALLKKKKKKKTAERVRIQSLTEIVSDVNTQAWAANKT